MSKTLGFDDLIEAVESRYDGETANVVRQRYSGHRNQLPEGNMRMKLNKIDARLPELHPEEYRENVYENDVLNEVYSIVKRSDAEYGGINKRFYKSMNPEDFKDANSVVLDHSCLFDMALKQNKFGVLKRNHKCRWDSLLNLADALDRSEKSYMIYIPENLYDVKNDSGEIHRTTNSYTYRALKAFNDLDFVRHFKLDDPRSADKSFCKLGENLDSVVVSTDEDFLDIEEEMDISVYPPDLAQIGFKMANI